MSFSAHISGQKSNASGRQNSSIGGTGEVPNAKKPRSRPPKSLRDKLGFLQGNLPPYSGPYSVGCMDIEVPVENPRTFSDIKRNGRHLLQLETVLFTLYYPAALGSGTGKDPAGHKKWSRATWLPRPRLQLAKAYGRFSGMPEPLAIAWCASTTMLTKLPAFRNSPPARHWPPEGTSKRSGYRHKDKQGPPPPGRSDDEPRFPLLFFSHGLGGTRTAYSTMCGEFASYGFVVCALEHRDGSGPRTFVNHTKKGEDVPKGSDQRVDHSEEEKEKGYDTVDYIFPKDNPYDTSPSNEQGIDAELRMSQIEFRLAEFEEAYRVLCEICKGNGEKIAGQNLRRDGYIGSSSRGLDGIDWSAWTNRFHTDKVTAAGHSFGAATVVEALRQADRFNFCHAGIIFDIFCAPIKPPEEDPRHRIHAPLLGINSEAFMYWQSNFDKVMALMEEAQEQDVPAFLCTVRGSVHLSQSDFTLLYPHSCSFFLKATVQPQRAIDLNISASLEFLREVTEGAGRSIIERCLTDEKLLETALLEELPDANKPDDEFIAAKLKITHEFRTRMGARVQRKFKRAKRHGFYMPGDEVWMHFKPEPEQLQAWKHGALERGKSHCVDSKVDDGACGEDVWETIEEAGTETQSGPSNTSQESWLGRPPSFRDGDET